MAWPVWGSRVVAAGGSAFAGAGAGLATNAVSDRPTVPWFVGLGVLVVLMVGLQVWLAILDSEPRPGRRIGAGAAFVGGSSTAPISTNVTGVRQAPGTEPVSGDVAGPGAAVVEGDSSGEICTRVRDVEGL